MHWGRMMGLDAIIDFRFNDDHDPSALDDLGYELAYKTRLPSSHPCIQERTYCAPDGDIQLWRVSTMQRYWGPGYERGSWPEIRAGLAILLYYQQRGVISDLAYYDDGAELREPVTDAMLAEFDDHYLCGEWTYVLADKFAAHPSWKLDRPVDAYAKPMFVYGVGTGGLILYGSPASGEERGLRVG